jgi:hypothetical protein
MFTDTGSTPWPLMFNNYGSTFDHGLNIFGSEVESTLNQLYYTGEFQKWSSRSNFMTKVNQTLQDIKAAPSPSTSGAQELGQNVATEGSD